MTTRLRHLLEMIRFSHTVFALPFALMSAVLAWATRTAGNAPVPFRARDLLGILLCMVCARSAAMAFNRLVDRDLDGQNPRTRMRHLPAGILSVRSVALFFVLMCGGFVLATLLFLPNWLPLALALPVMLFLCGYSFAKRFTSAAHFWLGAALMLAPIAAWIALRGAVVIHDPRDLLPALALGMAVLLWVAGFDIIYACQDAEFDRQSNLHSVPARWGVPRALRFAALCHLAMLFFLAAVPFVSLVGGPPVALGWPYAMGLSAVAVLLGYEHSIVRPTDLTRVNTAFFQVNAIVSLGLFGIVLLDLYCL